MKEQLKAFAQKHMGLLIGSGVGLLLGMMLPQEGNIYLHSEKPEMTLCAAPSTRALFSYVPQDNTLFSGTIAENLRITNPDATDEMLVDALKTACAYEFVSALPDGLDSRVGENGDGLSKGQIQRISVARALLSDAPVLLLDDVLSELDPGRQDFVLNQIDKGQVFITCCEPERFTKLGKTVQIEKGKTVATPEDPEKENCLFRGWYTDSAFTKRYDFAQPVTKNLTLYAKYEIDAATITNKISTDTIVRNLN